MAGRKACPTFLPADKRLRLFVFLVAIPVPVFGKRNRDAPKGCEFSTGSTFSEFGSIKAAQGFLATGFAFFHMNKSRDLLFFI